MELLRIPSTLGVLQSKSFLLFPCVGSTSELQTMDEHIYKDKSMLEVYDLSEAFCEVILILPFIQKQRDCPNDINEAASTLVFASARCGDLPELGKLRNLFGERIVRNLT